MSIKVYITCSNVDVGHSRALSRFIWYICVRVYVHSKFTIILISSSTIIFLEDHTERDSYNGIWWRTSEELL